MHSPRMVGPADTASAPATGAFRPADVAPSKRVPGLPAQLTSFVGRQREIEAGQRLLGTTRLLTLTGAGGTGKTRLAVEVVLREAAIRAAVWVELAPIADAALIPQAVMTVLGASDQSETPTQVERLAEVIADRELLLVLDNCEHLVDACAAAADGLLRRCPRLRVLATSREALGVTGETAWLVPPLTLPAADAGPMEDAEAVQLFVERARAVQPSFSLTPESRDAVAQICRRLDGLPLALELAAARLRALRPEQIAARLDDRFRLLTTGNRAALPRHQTLRAAIDWSHDLLEPRARRLLARLSVFTGGFTLEAAEQVCSDAELHQGEVLDLVSDLVEKSLVEMREAGDSARYALLETVRQYGAERLLESGEHAMLQARHADFHFALAAEAEPHLVTPRRPVWVARLRPELDNLRQALSWTREHDEVRHVRLVGMLHWFWFATGDWPEARQWLRSALTTAAGERPTRDRAAVQFSAGAIASLQARPDSALAHLEPAEALALAVGDERLAAYIRNYRAMAMTQRGSPEAEEPIRLAQGWLRASGDLYGLRLNLLLESTRLFALGDLAGAAQAGEEGVRVARVFGLGRELAISLQTLGMVVLRQGDVARATALYRESLEAVQLDPQPLFLSRSLELLGGCFVLQGSAREAARIYGAASAVREAIGARMWKLDADAHGPALARARTALGDAAFDEEYARGRRTPADAAIEFALTVAGSLAAADAVEPTTDTAEYAAFTQPPEPAPAQALRVRALGAVEASVQGVPVPRKAWGYGKVRELLVYLLLHPEGRTREQVGAALWPEASAAQVRNNFHVTLHTLRKVLGAADWVRFEGQRYRIDRTRGVELDALEFDARLTAGLRSARRGAAPVDELRDALALYRGEFLEGEEAGDWHFEVRDRLTRLCLEGHEALGAALLAQGAAGEAASVYERLLSRDPLDEGASRALMRCRAELGDRAGAVREYRRLEAALLRELECSPDEETREVFRTVARG